MKGLYQSYYRVIYFCNLILEKMASDTPVKQRVHAEAKAVRAFCHMDLVRLWGTPIMADHIITSAESSSMTNTPAADTWALVEQDLKDAAAVLPSKSGKDGQGAIGGRLTKEAALSLLGKAQVWQGKMSEAAATLRGVINSGLYELMPDIADLDRPTGDFGPEYVWEHNAVDDAGNATNQGDGRWVYLGWRSENIDNHPDRTGFVTATWGFGAVSADYAGFLLAHDGGKSARYRTQIADYGDVLAMGSGGTSLFGCSPPVVNNEGYFRIIKTPRLEDMIIKTFAWPSSARSKVNEPILRYSEVLLLYAEAQLSAGDDGSGLAALNQSRVRAGIPALLSYTLQDVKDEKRAELFFEGERYLDVVRWGDASTLLANKGKTWYSFYGYKDGTTELDVRTQSGPGSGWTEKYRYLPFPADELTANPSLTQNSSW